MAEYSTSRRERIMYGAVIVFREGTTQEEAERYVAKIRESPKVESITRAESFNAEYGEPVFYVP